MMDRHGWDDRYEGAELVWRAEPNEFLVSEVDALVAGRALDVACGEGRNAVWLAGKGWQATGVDFSAVGLDKARRLAAERGVVVDWVEADVVEWEPPPAAFDLVIVFYLHLPAELRHRVFVHAMEALATGGTLLVVGHDLANLARGDGGPQDPAVLYRPEDVAGELGGLRVERAISVEREVTTDDGKVFAIDALVRAVKP